MKSEQTKLQNTIDQAVEKRDECIRQLRDLTERSPAKIAELIVSGGDWEKEVAENQILEKQLKHRIDAYELALPVLQKQLEEAG